MIRVRSLGMPLYSRALVLAMCVGLAGCSKTEGYRYKLTLEVNTPDGIKRGSSVVEVEFWEVSIPARGVAHKLRGEALYLDLGPGRRPLIALLTKQLHPESDGWSRDGGPSLTYLRQLYDVPIASSVMESIAAMGKVRGARDISKDKLPDLVTFADVNDPAAVIEVDPNDLQATLGSGTSWTRTSIEITSDPVTQGIESKLPWMNTDSDKTLNGKHQPHLNALANRLSTVNFRQR